MVLPILALLVSACGDDGEPELTIEEELAIIEGRTLRPAEVEELLAVGETLCQMGEPVLDAVWFKLDGDQLAFQDLVFSRICPDRSIFYAGKTGRYVTEEATESGVVTSTSRPPSTTTTIRRTTTTRPSTGMSTSTSTGTSQAGGLGTSTTSASVGAGSGQSTSSSETTSVGEGG